MEDDILKHVMLMLMFDLNIIIFI